MAVSSISLIFLDVDGVLIDRFDKKVGDKIALEIQRLGEAGLNSGYPDGLVSKRAAARCFSPAAMVCLGNLIERVKAAARLAMNPIAEESVAIVISSPWREDADLDTLKNYVFADVFFRDLIIDKTPNSDLGCELAVIKDGEFEISKTPYYLSKEKYGFNLENDKGRSIDFWLRENHQNLKLKGDKKVNVKSILILDDDPYSEIWARFSKQSVLVGATLLSHDDVDQGYRILTDVPFSSDCFVSEEYVRKFMEEKKKYRQEHCAVS